VLKALSPEDFALLMPSMHHVELNLKAQLEIPYQPIEHVYFPEVGIASVVASMTGGRQSEVGIIGFDGMTGIAVILGQDSSPNETYVQVAGNGWCLPVENLRSEVAKSSRFARHCFAMPMTSLSSRPGRHWSTAIPRSRNGWPAGC
jgi:hypothetical protein